MLKMHTFAFQPLKHHMLQPPPTTFVAPQLAMACKHLRYAFFKLFARDNQHQHDKDFLSYKPWWEIVIEK
jgi:hypothetical protein